MKQAGRWCSGPHWSARGSSPDCVRSVWRLRVLHVHMCVFSGFFLQSNIIQRLICVSEPVSVGRRPGEPFTHL